MRAGRKLVRPGALPSLALVLSLGLGACETFDPAGWVTGPISKPERITAEGFDPDAPFPKLSQVPDAPPRPTPKRDRIGVAEDLAVQRDAAEYSSRVPLPGAPGGSAVEGESPSPDPSSSRASLPRQPRIPGPPPPPPVSIAKAGAPPPGPEDLVRATPPAAVPGLAARPPGELVAVFYYPGSASDLKPKDQDLIEEVALLHRQNGGRLRVVGHAAPRVRADGPGSWGLARLRLSLARAAKVARSLTALGSASEDVVVAAAADTDTVSAVDPGDARHHRVEIFLEQ